MHQELHADLYHFEVAVKIGSVAYNMLYRWKLKKDILMSPIAKLARTKKGRFAIGLGLGLFYENRLYMDKGQGPRTGDDLGSVFTREVLKYPQRKGHKWPNCKK